MADLPPFNGALARIEIRRGFEQAIKGATLAGQRVYRSRIFPLAMHDADGTLRQDVLPAILIYSGDEELEPFNAAPPETRRTLQIWVELIGQVREDFDDVLDVISAEVENLVELDDRLGDRLEDLELGFVQRTEPVRDGAVTLGCLRMRWDAIYHTQRDDTLVVPDLDTLEVTYDLVDDTDDTTDAVDTIDLTAP